MKYEETREEIIKDIQAEQLTLLKKLDEICKRNKIQYFLFWGSLIGAVRHHGFIPWDDDLDIGMMREDYEKLCAVDSSEWGSHCDFVQPTDSRDIHDKIFARIYVMKSKVQSPRDIIQWKLRRNGKPFSTSLTCDIYVFDYAPNKTLFFNVKQKRLLAIAKTYKLTKCIALVDKPGIKASIKVMCKNIIGSLLCKAFQEPWAFLANKYDSIAKSKFKTSRICCYCEGGEATYAPVEAYFPLKKTEFEDMEVCIPNNYDQLLRSYYGNYMEFPEIDKRYHIPFNYIEPGNGKRYVIENIPNSLADQDDVED